MIAATSYCERLLPKEQGGFHPRRSIINIKFTVRRLQELGHKSTRTAISMLHQPKEGISLRQPNAYLVGTRSPWSAAANDGAICQFHDGRRAYVQNDNEVSSEEFDLEQGLRRVWVLSPSLFNISRRYSVTLQRFNKDPDIVAGLVSLQGQPARIGP